MRHACIFKLAAVAAAVAFSGCNSDGSGSGSFSLGIKDAPVDGATHVYVQFSGVEIHGGGETKSFDFDTPKQIDLLALQGSDSAPLLDEVALDTGSYEWIRLKVDTTGTLDSYIEVDNGGQYELTIPSGAETGLKLVQGFDVPVNGSADFTLDFDLRKSVHSTSANYVLRPALRMVDNTQIGHIAGTVDATLLANSCGNSTDYAVYVFSGAGATPDDVGSAAEPLTTSLVSLTENVYSYEAGFLTAGDYTAALTCQAAADDPAADDQIAFVGQADVTVTAGQTVAHDFN